MRLSGRAHICVRIYIGMMYSTFILASNSPRRRQMLAWLNWPFEVRPANIDETPLPGEKAGDYTLRLAMGKAREAGKTTSSGVLILAADTTVSDEWGLLGKPEDVEDARRMLMRLRGKSHQVCTAVAIFDPQTDQLLTELCTSLVPMRAYTDEEIEEYIRSGDPLDKAGAYAIQHAGFHPVENFSGCFACVMGLPLCHLERALRKLEVYPSIDVPNTCQGNLSYQCPVFRAIQQGSF
jgi:septum formation protein